MVTPQGKPARVVVLGGGFGGLAVARGLRRAPVEVVVVDRRNHHTFQPLLYQVATAGLSTQHVSSPLRKILRGQRNASVLYAEATGFDLERGQLELANGSLHYDWLVVAPGVTHAYFGHDEWSDHAPGLKTLGDATRMRGRILRAFELAERSDDPAERERLGTFVIVGAGPTGVELAGAIAELSRHTLPGDFRRFDPRSARIVLVEGGDRVLPSYPAELSAKARKQLERLGVDVRTNTLVTDVNGQQVQLGGSELATSTVLWAAGVAPPRILADLPGARDAVGRIQVENDLTVPGHTNVFVIGDAASIESNGRPVPGVAPAAIQMGQHAARNLCAALAGRSTKPFRYRDKGSLATIGRAAAVADFGRLRFSGTPAWILWLTVHLIFLVGFRSRLIVMFEWIWSWMTYQRVARSIIEAADEDGDPP